MYLHLGCTAICLITGAGGWRWEHQLCVHCGGAFWGSGAEAGAALHQNRPRLASHTGMHEGALPHDFFAGDPFPGM